MRHIPNILSAFRILLVPLLAWLMLEEHYYQAAAVLVLSGLTDLLDGFLARRFGWITNLGKVLDPAADKLTQVTVYLLLAFKLPRYWYFFALLLGKDLVMLVLGGWLLKRKVKIEGARWFGKIVTILFYVISVLLIFFPNLPSWATISLLALITVLALVAGLLYIPQFLQYRRQAKQPDDAPATPDE
ncbi:CDP-alcohol phosphatidyltransferase family protein [Ruminococcaceae bacterium OttesenSCG-928-O06]|nr:CDP-alcohol phosphatidyltransferase family protein [Ruminococcaceae bacterium OttesenSCG-928-O06]